jgi:putative FmdB family regulatory protein
MPTYEYECTRCGHTFEEFKAMSAPRRQRCPLCRGKVERLIGGAAIMFKGSGFYVNDSRRQAAAHQSATGKSSGDNADAAVSGTDGPAQKSNGEKSNAKSGEKSGDNSRNSTGAQSNAAKKTAAKN